MKMPFGKHKGKDIADLPIEYCRWVVKQDWFKEDARIEIRKRVGIDFETIAKLYQAECTKMANQLAHIYRQLSIHFHPDRGGDTKAMQFINNLFGK